QEDAEAERLAVLIDVRLWRFRPDAEVDVEVALERREPWDTPAHPRPVRVDLGDRGTGDERERRAAGGQVGEVADLVDEHRPAVAHALISIEGDPPGSVSPGTLAGDTATQIPRATSATARTGASRGPRGRTFSAKIATATTAIQNRLITPSTNRTAIMAPEQPA